MGNIQIEKLTAPNSTRKELVVLCYVETFVIHGNFVLRNYIRAERRQLLVASNCYLQPVLHNCATNILRKITSLNTLILWKKVKTSKI